MKRLHSWRRLTPAPTVLLHQRRQPNIFRALEPSVESRLHFSFLILLSSFRRHNVWKRRWFASSDHTTDPPAMSHISCLPRLSTGLPKEGDDGLAAQTDFLGQADNSSDRACSWCWVLCPGKRGLRSSISHCREIEVSSQIWTLSAGRSRHILFYVSLIHCVSRTLALHGLKTKQHATVNDSGARL